MPIPATPPYVCEQLFYVDQMKESTIAEVQEFFQRNTKSAHVRVFVELRDPTQKKQFLERLEFLIFRRIIFKFIGDDVYLDISESEASALVNMPEVTDVAVMGPAK
jgi:hypothetical protein